MSVVQECLVSSGGSKHQLLTTHKNNRPIVVSPLLLYIVLTVVKA